jgi:hypothetical protein
MGKIKETFRSPLCSMEDKNKESLLAEMKHVGLL